MIYPFLKFIVHRQRVELDGVDKNLAYDGDAEESGDAEEYWDAEEDGSAEEAIDGTNEGDLGGGRMVTIRRYFRYSK